MTSGKRFDRRLLVLACVAGLGFGDATAQEVDAKQDKSSKTLDAVTVTGTRISNPDVISPTPVATITADAIKATGAVNIGDLLTTLPQLATTFTMGNSTQYIGTAGVQMLDLRNLGPERTLVLVNGRRFVGASSGSTAVDVNLIPTEWVERVEIITGGASAVYGADAVTGVVNFILKKNYQGVNLHAQYGASQHGGFSPKQAAITGGMNFAEGRGNVAASVEHSEQDALMFSERFGNKSYTTILTPDGPYDSALFPNAGSYSYTDGGTFYLGKKSTDISKRYVFNPDGSVRQQRFGGIYDDAGQCSDCDRLDANKVQMLQPRYGRTSASSVVSFDLTPEHRLYFEGSYSHVDVKKLAQPAFGTYTIDRDNAFVSPSLANLMDINGLDSIDVSRFDTDAGVRGEDTKRNTTRVVFGGNGIITGDLEYDTSLNYGFTDETRHNLNNRILDRFAASIDAVKDANGNIVCRSSIDSAAAAALDPIARSGCIPTSIFGTGSIDPAAARWFNTTTTTRTQITQFVGGATVTNNDLFQMPLDAGAASLAAGVEFRRETSRQINDPLDVEGLTFLNAIPSSGGAYNVKEGYIETAVPLLANQYFAKNLTFDAAVRFSDYSTIGHTKAWRWGLDWSIDDNVRLRGTMSSAVRAPNIDELYSGQTQNYFTATDPCTASQINNGSASRAANCQALGVPAGWVSTRTRTIEGISGSNPNLKPETGKTWTTGMVFTPQFLPGFGVTMDYWNIRLSNAISAPSGTDIVNQCVDSPNGIANPYCGSTLRDPETHELTFINSIYQNISALSTSGVDIGAYYTRPIGAGKLRLSGNGTRVFLYTEHPFQDDPSIAIQRNGTGGFPKWKVTLSTNYAVKNWAFDWRTRYFSRMLRVSNESYSANPTQTTPIWMGAGFFNDARVGYTIKNGDQDGGLEIYAGITNLFDRDPPVNLFGTGLASALYDTLGRSYYAGFNYKF